MATPLREENFQLTLEEDLNGVWWEMPLIPEFRRWKWEDQRVKNNNNNSINK